MDYMKDHIKKLVSQYLKTKYKSYERIPCRFDLYRIDIMHRDKVEKYHWTAELTKREYGAIMRALLAYPNLTFQDLPRYIPFNIYDKLIFQLRFPYHGNILHLYIDPSRSLPVAVEMTTLQQDAHEISGEDMYSFCLPTLQKGMFENQEITLRLKKMEVGMWHAFENPPIEVRYVGIDALEVESVLGATDYKGIETGLNNVYQELLKKETPEPLWLIHWLDENSISYTEVKEDEE